MTNAAKLDHSYISGIPLFDPYEGISLLERRFLNALEWYHSPWNPPNCRWTLLFLLWKRTSEYPASEDEIRELLDSEYFPLGTSEDRRPWDICVWHSMSDRTRILHVGILTEWWLVKSREWPELGDLITEKTSWELSEIIERDCRDLDPMKSWWLYTLIKYYRKK